MNGNLLNKEEINSIIKNIFPKLKTYMAEFRKNTPRVQTTVKKEKADYTTQWNDHIDKYIEMYMNEYGRIFSEFLKKSLDPSFYIFVLKKIQCNEFYKDQIRRERKAERARERLKDPEKRLKKNAKQREWYRKRYEDPQKRKEENARQREWYRKRYEDPQKRKEKNARKKERNKNIKNLINEQKVKAVENAKVVFPKMINPVNTLEAFTYPSSSINEPMSNQMEGLNNLEKSKDIRCINDGSLNYLKDQLKNTPYNRENKLVEKKDELVSNGKKDLLKEALEESEIDLETDNLIEGYLEFFKQNGDDLGKLLDNLEHESENQKVLELIEKGHPEASSRKKSISKQLEEIIKKRPLISQKNQKELRSLKNDFKGING